MNQERREWLEFARGIAEKAGEVVLRGFHQASRGRLKPDGSMVTDTDLAAEELLRNEIARQYPSHGIYGEEHGLANPESSYRWILDPLDGTRWFMLGVPIFGVLVALAEKGEPTVGAIHFPVSGETVFAAAGAGCWHTTRGCVPVRCQVAPVESLAAATVSASGLHGSNLSPPPTADRKNLAAVASAAAAFQFCGDCLQHALLCRGRIQVAIDTVMQPWDIAALVPCIREAGGVAASFSGRREGLLEAGHLISAASESLLAETLALLHDGTSGPDGGFLL